MPRGRKPKDPDADLKLGERADRVKPETAAPIPGRPEPPKHLDKVAKEEFSRVVDLLERQGTLSASDGQSIALYAETHSRWCRAKSELETAGDYITLPNGIVCQHPAFKTIDKCVSQMTRLLTEFGLTPQSRKKVPVNKPKDTAADGWEGLL